uniref:Uncharacterized protein n=1 Tax=Anguilla anguilla TaxID=7936 RepID=A0A0E9PC60_ANGAN
MAVVCKRTGLKFNCITSSKAASLALENPNPLLY